MYVGTDYYPEHWNRERWETDAKLMQEAGFNVVRLAEFAWVNMEPSEGTFTFEWLDDALAVLARHDISVVLCTPTAVMPAWVASKYPECLATRADGSKVVWGVRKNNCFSINVYRRLSERITRAMAEHFADTPNVIGWQTDNEFSGSHRTTTSVIAQPVEPISRHGCKTGTATWTHLIAARACISGDTTSRRGQRSPFRKIATTTTRVCVWSTTVTPVG